MTTEFFCFVVRYKQVFWTEHSELVCVLSQRKQVDEGWVKALVTYSSLSDSLFSLSWYLFYYNHPKVLVGTERYPYQQSFIVRTVRHRGEWRSDVTAHWGCEEGRSMEPSSKPQQPTVNCVTLRESKLSGNFVFANCWRREEKRILFSIIVAIKRNNLEANLFLLRGRRRGREDPAMFKVSYVTLTSSSDHEMNPLTTSHLHWGSSRLWMMSLLAGRQSTYISTSDKGKGTVTQQR